MLRYLSNFDNQEMWDGTGNRPTSYQNQRTAKTAVAKYTEENQVYAGLEYLEKICAKKKFVLDFEYLC